MHQTSRSQAFISYSARDASLAGAVYAYLKTNGIQAVKAPDDIPPGEDWAASITALIEDSSYFVLLWTHNSMASKEVAKELTLAMSCGARIIPFRAEDLSPEGAWRYHLTNVQWLEAHTMPEAMALDALVNYFSRFSPTRERVDQPSSGVVDKQARSEAQEEEVIPASRPQVTPYRQREPTQERRPDSTEPVQASKSSRADRVIKDASDLEHHPTNHKEYDAALHVAVTLGFSDLDKSSPARSRRGLVHYLLCNHDGDVLARVPIGMVDARLKAKNRSKHSSNEDSLEKGAETLKTEPNETEREDITYTRTIEYKLAIDLAKRMGHQDLENASQENSSRGIVNYCIRGKDGKTIASIPLSMLRNAMR